MTGAMIFYIGLIIMGIALLSGLIALIILIITRKTLNKKLDIEYGKRRH